MINNKLICLGLEGTAHTFSAGIITDKGEILSNILDIYKPKKGGLIPRECAEHHANVAKKVIQEALKKAKIKMKDIDVVAFSAGPGLPPALRVTAVIARVLSLKYKKSIISVNHSCAHLEIARLTTNAKNPVFLYCSGGNTAVIAFVEGRYRCFGETMDIAIGNAIDMFAREAGLQHPGGPKIEELAKKGKWVELPYVVKGMDLSFSGILTDAIKKLKSNKLEDICFSIQETCFSMLTEVVERAVAHTDKEEVLLTGGVAANKRLQQMLSIMCKERGAKFYVVPSEYAGDCGINIAYTGLLAYKSGQRQKIKETKINQKWRTDEVDVKWIN